MTVMGTTPPPKQNHCMEAHSCHTCYRSTVWQASSPQHKVLRAQNPPTSCALSSMRCHLVTESPGRMFAPRPLERLPRPDVRVPEGHISNGGWCQRFKRPAVTGGGGGDNFAGKISEGENYATLANPKAYTASRTRCTAKAPRFRQGKFSPPPRRRNFPTKLSPSPPVLYH